MNTFYQLFNGIWFTLVVISVLVLTNVVNSKGYLIPLYNWLLSRVKSKRLLLALISTVSGVLPIPGRTIISAGVLDTLSSKDSNRKNYGVINYLATHHYYLWSPLEGTVLIPLSVLGISYAAFFYKVLPLLLTITTITLYYIFFVIKEEDIVINKSHNLKKIQKSFFEINWSLVRSVAIIIILSNYIKLHSESLLEFLLKYNYSIALGGLIAFISSFILGSSSKFAGITSLLITIFGIKYLPLLFSLGYSGYLISPMHKCLIINKKYFNLSIRHYLILMLISIVLVVVGYLSV